MLRRKIRELEARIAALEAPTRWGPFPAVEIPSVTVDVSTEWRDQVALYASPDAFEQAEDAWWGVYL